MEIISTTQLTRITNYHLRITSMINLAADFKAFIQKIVNQLREDLKTIRTGRANPAILEGIIVETYGGQTKLKLNELSTITTDESAVLIITPFDPSTTQDVEKAILKSPLGINPQVQGTKILVRIPPLSEEQRLKLVKIINQKVEEKKTIIRNQRDEVRRKIKHQFEAKEMTEDQKFRLEKDIDTLTHNCMTEIDTVKKSKDQEIMEV